jgi:hypothetical protein
MAQVFQVSCDFWQELFFILGSDTFAMHFYSCTSRKTSFRNGLRITNERSLYDHGQSFCFSVLAVWSLPGRSSVLKTAGTSISCKHVCFLSALTLDNYFPDPVPKNRTVLLQCCGIPDPDP